MRVHVKFKVMCIHPRPLLVRFFVQNDHCVHVLLDNGQITYVHVPTPRYYDEKQYRQFITDALKEKLEHSFWFFTRHRKFLLETIGTYLERIEESQKSYEFAGSEAELEVQV